jgi:hypothetical protein
MDVCLLSGRGLCDELINPPEDFYRLWRVVVCDHDISWYEETIARAGLQSQRNKQTDYKAPRYVVLSSLLLPLPSGPKDPSEHPVF